MLNPLTEVVVAMLVTIRIGCGQFVVHILCDGERRNGEQQ